MDALVSCKSGAKALRIIGRSHTRHQLQPAIIMQTSAKHLQQWQLQTYSKYSPHAIGATHAPTWLRGRNDAIVKLSVRSFIKNAVLCSTNAIFAGNLGMVGRHPDVTDLEIMRWWLVEIL